MIWFLAGAIVGATVATVVMAALCAAGRTDREAG